MVQTIKHKYVLMIFCVFLVLSGLSCQPDIPPIPPATDQVSFIVDDTSVTLKPGPGSTLYNMDNVSSGVLLMDVLVEKGICDKDYFPLQIPPRVIKKGEPCIIVSGTVLNTDKDNFELAMWAEGFSKDGQRVSWTIDSAHITGQIGLRVEYGKTGDFIIHMYPDENLETIKVFSAGYEITPP